MYRTVINVIGVCCDAGRHHIRAMAESLGRTVPAGEYSPQLAMHTIIGDASPLKEKDARILYEQPYGRSKK